jgi:hypothetical protein
MYFETHIQLPNVKLLRSSFVDIQYTQRIVRISRCRERAFHGSQRKGLLFDYTHSLITCLACCKAAWTHPDYAGRCLHRSHLQQGARFLRA